METVPAFQTLSQIDTLLATGAAATQVLALASGLALQSERLRSEVGRFLVTVRAG